MVPSNSSRLVGLATAPHVGPPPDEDADRLLLDTTMVLLETGALLLETTMVLLDTAALLEATAVDEDNGALELEPGAALLLVIAVLEDGARLLLVTVVLEDPPMVLVPAVLVPAMLVPAMLVAPEPDCAVLVAPLPVDVLAREELPPDAVPLEAGREELPTALDPWLAELPPLATVPLLPPPVPLGSHVPVSRLHV